MRRHIILATLLVGMSCGGSPRQKSPNSGSNSTPNSSSNFNPNSVTPNSGNPSDIEARLWATICDVAFNCPDASPELLSVAGRFASASECAATGDFPGLDFESEQLEASVAAGRLRWDDALADQCFAGIRAVMCDGGGFDDSPSCDNVLVGLVPAGGTCATSDECFDGLDCVEEGEDCFGTCMPNCFEDQCTGEQTCDFVDQSCKSPGNVGDSCDWDPDCANPLFCDDGGSCSAGGNVAGGGSCSSTVECEGDLICFQGRCGTVQRLDPGASCSLGDVITAYCKAGTVCTNLQVDGQQLVGTCALAQPQGAACRLTFECRWGLFCDADSPLEIGSCVPAVAVGEACGDDSQCVSLNCNDGACVELGGDEVCALP